MIEDIKFTIQQQLDDQADLTKCWAWGLPCDWPANYDVPELRFKPESFYLSHSYLIECHRCGSVVERYLRLKKATCKDCKVENQRMIYRRTLEKKADPLKLK